jgi:hypothetical protein
MPECQKVSSPVGTGAAAFGIFLVVATALAAVPQILLLLRRKTSDGLSVTTPALALTYGYFNLCATTIVKWPTK